MPIGLHSLAGEVGVFLFRVALFQGNLQYLCCVSNTTTIDCHICNVLFDDRRMRIAPLEMVKSGDEAAAAATPMLTQVTLKSLHRTLPFFTKFLLPQSGQYTSSKIIPSAVA